MFKKNLITQAVAIALILPGVSLAEIEISGAAKIEYGLFTGDGQLTGSSSATESGDTIKSEGSVKLFINSDIGEESAIHAELLLADDGESASNRLDGGESYTQYEVLRELYIDTNAAGWDLRLGKQQVVWGTADGIKLLDIINPTDFRELNQNTTEDARIPVWMVNAEKELDNGANIQVIFSEAQPNFIAGLDAGGDSGAPFIFKGVDTITGKTNGFVNVAKDMGQTSGIFQNLLQLGGLTGLVGGPMSFQTVSSFTAIGTSRSPLVPDDGVNPANGTHNLSFNDVSAQLNAALTGTNLALFNKVFFGVLTAQSYANGDQVLAGAANDGTGLFTAFNNHLGGTLVPAALSVLTYGTATATQVQDVDAVNFLLNAMGVTSAGGTANPGATPLDLTDDATRAGFAAAFAGMTPAQQQAAFNTAQVQGLSQVFGDGTTNQFESGVLDVNTPQSAFDYMGNTTFATFDAFIGMKTEYRKDYDNDPFSEQNLGFRYKNSTESGMNYSLNYAYRMDTNPIVEMHWEDSAGNKLNVVETVTDLDAQGLPVGSPGAGTKAFDVTTVSLASGNGTAFDSQSGANPATLVFEESLNRVSTLGGSFDMALDGMSVPVVLRGELSLDVGAKQPVIDRGKLGIGNLTEALTMQDGDIFKYVFGVDVTVMTNLLVSTQLIQFYNLDYIDDASRYTGDFSSMHLTNGLNKGDEVETFVSLFLSKPFGSDVQHRWNNITIAENGGGYWNRFDVEYSFNDEMLGTVELNSYWGDDNTTFGQFEDSSNLQVGFKYIF